MEIIEFDYLLERPDHRELVVVEHYRGGEEMRIPLSISHAYVTPIGEAYPRWHWNQRPMYAFMSVSFPVLFWFSDGTIGMCSSRYRNSALEALGCRRRNRADPNEWTEMVYTFNTNWPSYSRSTSSSGYTSNNTNIF